MRILLLLLTALLSMNLLPATAMATQERSASSSTPQTRGSIPSNRITTLPQPDKADIAQANAVGATCSNSTEKNYFDCDCVALSYLQQLTIAKVTGKTGDTYVMKNTAKQACPNRVALAGRNYTVCMGWAPRVRRDYEEFCSCYGNAYANKFAQKPAVSLADNKLITAAALKACNAGSSVVDRMTREARLKEMQQNGIYNEMFPSAPVKAPTTEAARPAPLQPWQQMQKTLTDPQSQPRKP